MRTAFNGILNVNKESGMTSHDVVALLRRITGQRRIGHTGTLDPLATGVLPLCLGTATRLAEYITDGTKSYRCSMRLGIQTDTLDDTGQVLRTDTIPEVSTAQVQAVFRSLEGVQWQKPPMYSAVKIGGRKLYELAREGKIIDRPARRIEIFSLRLLEKTENTLTFQCDCSKGTYLRVLVEQIADALGTLGTMTALERTRSASFSIEDAVPVARLRADGTALVQRHLRTPEEAVAHLPALRLDAPLAERAAHGLWLAERRLPSLPETEVIAVYAPEGLIGIGTPRLVDGERGLQMKKVLRPSGTH